MAKEKKKAEEVPEEVPADEVPVEVEPKRARLSEAEIEERYQAFLKKTRR